MINAVEFALVAGSVRREHRFRLLTALQPSSARRLWIPQACLHQHRDLPGAVEYKQRLAVQAPARSAMASASAIVPFISIEIYLS